jgi:NADH:ubiquinone oxidoreductase subunit 6 (subunit J)
MLQHLLNSSYLLLGVQSFVLFCIFILFALRNVLMSVLVLICLFIAVCFCFIFLDAAYLALVFIIVYVGAIAILFLFVIMLTNRIYSTGFNFWVIFWGLSAFLVFLDVVFSFGVNFLSGDFFWFVTNYDLRLFGDLRVRLSSANDPLVSLGFVFFNFFGWYLLGLGLLLVIVLVGVVLLLRVALRNTLVVHRVMEVEQIRWQRVLKFREFVRLRGHDSAKY